MSKKQYSPKLKFQVVLEALSGEKTPGQIAKQYGIHPNSVRLWKEEFLDQRRHSTIGYRAPSAFIATLQPWS